MSGHSHCANSKSSDYLKLLRFCAIDPAVCDSGKPATATEFTDSLNRLGEIPENIQPLLPVAYHNSVQAGCFDKLDPAAQSFIKLNSMSLVGGEIVKARWLQKAIASFGSADIPIIILKGMAFSGYLYRDDAPRTGIDVDILVRSRDFDKASDLLADSMEPVVLSRTRLATHRTLFERVFVPSEGSGPAVELHRGLTNPYIFNISEDRLWDSSEAHPRFKDEYARVLSPENTLLHLAVHAFRDMDFCSHNLLDVHRLIFLRGFDENLLHRMSTEWGARAVLYHLLNNARELMGSKVSQQFLQKLAPGGFRRRLQERLLNQSATPTAQNRARQLTGQLVFPDRPAGALRFQLHYANTRVKDLIFS